MPSPFNIRQIWELSYDSYCASSHFQSDVQRKASRAILSCGTGSLGMNLSICPDCGHRELHNNSCRNRNCPNCQAVKKELWVDSRRAEVIDSPYFHVVFTLPHELNSLLYSNQKLLYGMFHRCCARTLLELSADPKFLGALPGIIQVLHTWNQELDYHVHMHCIISGGGLTKDNKLRKSKDRFFIPVFVLRDKFKGKFLAHLNQLHTDHKLTFSESCLKLRNSYEWASFRNSLYQKDWCPYIKETFNGNGNAVKYLARYAYRTAIANSRIVTVSEEEVSFRYKDYADGSKAKTLTVTSEEFVGLFLQHVLPKGFCRIRFAGFLANSCKTEKLKLICRLRNTVFRENPVRGKNTAYLLKLIYGTDICTCPNCRSALRFLRASPGIGKEDLLDFCFRSSKTV